MFARDQIIYRKSDGKEHQMCLNRGLGYICVTNTNGDHFEAKEEDFSIAPILTTGKSVYLAGKMRGVPQFNFPAFDAAAKDLRERGYSVFSPADRDRLDGFDPEKDEAKDLSYYMAIDLPEVCKADLMVVLPGWETSEGVSIEMAVARKLGKKIVSYPSMEPIPDALSKIYEEVRVVDPQTGGAKGAKLAKFSMIPAQCILELAEHYGKGEKKYPSPKPGQANWQLGYRWSLSLDAAMRHFNAFMRGEQCDAETGTHHLICCAWHCFAVVWFDRNSKGTDDRSVA